MKTKIEATPVLDIPLDTRERLNYLDGLRAVAALTVLWAHALFTAFDGRGLGGWSALVGNYQASHEAVLLFIVLSGFCLALPVVRAGGDLRGGARLFYLRRARRILPPYYAALSLSLLLIWLVIGHANGPQWGMSVPVTWRGLLLNLLLVQDIASVPQIDYPLWTVAVEWKIYFLLPLLLWGWKRFGMLRTNAAFFAAAGLLYALTVRTPYWHSSPHFLALFVLGATAARLSLIAPALRWQPALLPASGLIFGIAYFAVRRLPDTPHNWGAGLCDTLLGAAGAGLLLGLAQQPLHPLRRALSWKPLVAVGGFSYSLYLLHAPLLEVLHQRIFSPVEAILLTYDIIPNSLWMYTGFVMLGTPVIVLWCYLFHLVAERPFMSGKANFHSVPTNMHSYETLKSVKSTCAPVPVSMPE